MSQFEPSALSLSILSKSLLVVWSDVEVDAIAKSYDLSSLYGNLVFEPWAHNLLELVIMLSSQYENYIEMRIANLVVMLGTVCNE